jgi:hypothetical protein
LGTDRSKDPIAKKFIKDFDKAVKIHLKELKAIAPK